MTGPTAASQDATTEQTLAQGFPQPSLEQWTALVEKSLKGASPAKLEARSADGIEINPLYTRADGPAAAGSAVPGAAPFTRGAAAGGGQGWSISSVIAESDPARVAAALADDGAAGAHAATIRIEAPGQSGLAADFKAIEAAVAAALAGKLKVSLAAGGQAIHAGLALTTVAKAKGALGSIGHLGIDPLGTLARTGELVLMNGDGRGFALGVPWLGDGSTTLLADARPYHEAGASEAQELAALAATLTAYLRCAEGESMSPLSALPRIGIAMAADADLFLTIAKLRAARRIVWRIAEACGAGEAAGRVPLLVTTSERMMTRRDPWVNMLRVTAATAAAAFGGASEITALPFTWPLGKPDAFARRIARNTGLVLAEESALGRVADPAGGSWYVERLTEELTAKGWKTFQEWEAEGGMLAALKGGLVQDQIAAVADARARAIATGRIALTGSTAFPMLGDDGVKVEPWPSAPAATAATVARALPLRRLAEPFERLRDAADAGAKRPKVFLAALGPLAEHGARSSWVRNALAVGGIEGVMGGEITSSQAAGAAFAEAGATAACICATDTTTQQLGEATAMALKAAGAKAVYVAGRHPQQEPALRAAGVDGFIFAGQDMIEALSSIQERAR